MEIRIIKKPITRSEIKEIAARQFGNLVKAVVDTDLRIMAIAGELHADEESFLLEHGSSQQHLWGINIYPERIDEDWIEFDSMVNVRPSQGNMSRTLEDTKTQEQIRSIVSDLIK